MRLGDEIDGHELVMRFNHHLPSSSRGGDLGTRTTVRFLTGGYGIFDHTHTWVNDPEPLHPYPDLFAVTYLNDGNDIPHFVKAAEMLSRAGLRLPLLMSPELIQALRSHEQAMHIAAGAPALALAVALVCQLHVALAVALMVALQV